MSLRRRLPVIILYISLYIIVLALLLLAPPHGGLAHYHRGGLALPIMGFVLIIGSPLVLWVSQALLSPEQEVRSRVMAFLGVGIPILAVVIPICVIISAAIGLGQGLASEETGEHPSSPFPDLLCCCPIIVFILVLWLVSTLDLTMLIPMAKTIWGLNYLALSTTGFFILIRDLWKAFFITLVLSGLLVVVWLIGELLSMTSKSPESEV